MMLLCQNVLLSENIDTTNFIIKQQQLRQIEDALKTCLEEVLKTCLEDALKTYLEDVLKTCLEDLLKILWRRPKYLLGISVYLSRYNKSKCVSTKSVFHKSISENCKANPKCINYW